MSRSSSYKTTNDLMQLRNPIEQSTSISLLTDKHFDKCDKTESKLYNTDIQKNINGKWDIYDYRNTGEPYVWGPSFWFTLHNGASRYPEKASTSYKERAIGFIKGIPVMIPCDTCAEHATAYIELNMRHIDKITSGRKELFNFFVDFHNYVNKRYNKPEMSYEDAEKMYNGKIKISKFSYH